MTPNHTPTHTHMKTWRMVYIWNDCYIQSLALGFPGPAFQFDTLCSFPLSSRVLSQANQNDQIV